MLFNDQMVRSRLVALVAGTVTMSAAVAVAAPVQSTWTPARNVSSPGSSAFAPAVLSSADGDRLYAAWDRLSGGSNVIQVTRSADGGQTWTDPLDVSDPVGSSISASIAGSRDGSRATIVWRRSFPTGGRIQTASTTDAGATWSSPMEISAANGDAEQPKAVAAANGSRFMSVWRRYNGSNFVIQSAHSTDGGTTWRAPETLSNPGVNAQYPQVALSDDGLRAAAVWERNNVIQSAATVDGGGTWSSPVPVSVPGQAGVIPRITATADGTRVVAVWYTATASDTRITVAVSTDGGASWSAPTFISAAGLVSMMPRIVMSSDGSRVTAVWGDGPDAQPRRIVSASSTDGGTTWSAPLQVSLAGAAANLNALVASTDGSRMTAAWSRQDGTNLRVQTASSTDHGATWSPPQTLSGAGQDGFSPTLATSANGIRVAAMWTRSDGTNIRVQASSGIVASSPGAPGTPTATPSDTSASIAWTPADDGGAAVASYTATASPGGQTCTSATISCTLTGLTNATTYAVTVTATNAVGTGPASAPTSVTPAAPLTPTKRPRALVKAHAGRSKLRVVVKPNLSAGQQWRFQVLRKQGKNWRKVGKVRRTAGSKHRRILNLPRGTYRVEVLAIPGYSTSTSKAVRLRR